MPRVGQARQREDGLLGCFRSGIHVEGVRDDASIQDDTGDPVLGPCEADPADRRPRESERGLIARGLRQRGGPLTVRVIPIALRPAARVGNGRIGLLVALSRLHHVEGVHDDNGSPRGRVLPACDLDRQGVARVGKAIRLEELRLDLDSVDGVWGSEAVHFGHEDSIQGYASDPVVGSDRA